MTGLRRNSTDVINNKWWPMGVALNRALVVSCACGLSLLGVLSSGCADCACGHRPTACTEENHKISDERMQHAIAMAHNQIYLVTDMERHTDSDGRYYYTFAFNPQWPDYPFAHTEIGRVAEKDVLVWQPYDIGPSGEWVTLILATYDGVQLVQPEIKVRATAAHG